MTITARFSSTCPDCNNPVKVGDKVNWTPGEKATHVQCPPAIAPVVLVDPTPNTQATVGGFAIEPTKPVTKGIYTVVFGNNEDNRTTLKVSTATKASKYAGTTYVSVKKAGGPYGDYQRFAKLENDGTMLVLLPWAKSTFPELDRLVSAFATIAVDPATAGLAYSLESNCCYRCNRELTVPASINAGLGSECQKYLMTA